MTETIDIQARLDEQSLVPIFAQMERFRVVTGKSMGEALVFAAWGVSRTLGTSTRIAPKWRDISPVAQLVNLGASRKKDRKGLTIFEVANHPQSRGDRTRFVAARSPAAIKRGEGNLAFRSKDGARWGVSKTLAYPPKIWKSGLAKASWGWAQRGLGSPAGAFGGVTALARKNAQRESSVERRLTGDDMYIRIENRLNYVTEAMIGGESGIDGALERAARHMAHVIDDKVEKELGWLKAKW